MRLILYCLSYSKDSNINFLNFLINLCFGFISLIEMSRSFQNFTPLYATKFLPFSVHTEGRKIFLVVDCLVL